MIPEDKQPLVSRALREAFDVSEFEDSRLLTGGLSTALVYRIVVQGKPYLLRIIMRTDAMFDPTNQFANMTTAADAGIAPIRGIGPIRGIAPRIRYASVEDRIMISDFVEAKPFPENMALLMANVVRTLHTLPGFHKPIMGNYLDTMDGFVNQLQAAKLLPESVTEELFRHYGEAMRAYPRGDAELVASHNDLKPQNIVFDGERVWLVDWEAAFLNDPYVDLAVAANFFVRDDAEEEAYLSAYFGEPASAYQRARFYLMRQVMHMIYAAFLMLQAARAGVSIEPDLSAPDFRAFHDGLISGEITLLYEERVQYAKVHLNAALREMRAPRFEESLARAAEAHVPSPE